MKVLISIIAFFSVTAFAQMEMDACKKAFSNEPYCVSHINAENACKLVDGSEQTFATMTKCLTQFSQMYGGMSPQLQMLCLAGYQMTGAAADDASDCAK